MKRYLIIFKGRVQGVGFRYEVSRLALSLNLKGYVKNLYTEDVECQIQGKEEDINSFLKDIFNTPNHWIRIDDYSIRELPIVEDENKFRVEY